MTDTSLRAEVEALKTAATELLADVRRRYPGEELRCPYMIALDKAVAALPPDSGRGGEQSEDDGFSPGDRASLFFEWCALNGFGLGGWPDGSAEQLIAHFKAAAHVRPKCRACGGNDGDTPCAYPSEGANGCLRDVRLKRERAAMDALADYEKKADWYLCTDRDAAFEQYTKARETLIAALTDPWQPLPPAPGAPQEPTQQRPFEEVPSLHGVVLEHFAGAAPAPSARGEGELRKAAADLIADVRRRYPGEELRCPYMIALDRALTSGKGDGR